MVLFLVNDFFLYDPKSTGNKNKNGEMGLQQTKKICTVQEIVNRQPKEWENTFANHHLIRNNKQNI